MKRFDDVLLEAAEHIHEGGENKYCCNVIEHIAGNNSRAHKLFCGLFAPTYDPIEKDEKRWGSTWMDYKHENYINPAQHQTEARILALLLTREIHLKTSKRRPK